MRRTVICVILALAALAVPPAALADGDPASDVLVSSDYFDPADLSAPVATTAELAAVLKASARAGFPIRVALIASQGDLGTVTSLWRRPGKYALYLQDELSEQYGGQILVVMPDGFGLHGPVRGPDAVDAAESGVRALAPGSGATLVDAAISAVPKLAAAAGHPIPAGELEAARHAVVRGGTVGTGSGQVVDLATLLSGALLLAAAWTASLRARPWRTRPGSQPAP